MKIALLLIGCLSYATISFFKTDVSYIFQTSKSTKITQNVKLVPMDIKGFKDLKEKYVLRSTDNHIKSDLDSKEDAYTHASNQINRIFYDGLDTPSHMLFDIVAEDINKKIGTLWLWKNYEGHIPILYLYDICIFDEFQNKGYGTAVIKLYEEKAREMGARKLRLQVFTHNEGARRLYTRMGFFTTGHNMAKKLD